MSHILHIYKNDEELGTEVTKYIQESFKTGGAALIIARPAHRELLKRELSKAAIDVALLKESRQLVMLDAAETLKSFLVNGIPDAAKFHWVIGGEIDRIKTRFSKINAYGEMVSLLWESGKRAETIVLEQLWNDLLTAKSFELRCGYAGSQFRPEDMRDLKKICAEHTSVIPEKLVL